MYRQLIFVNSASLSMDNLQTLIARSFGIRFLDNPLSLIGLVTAAYWLVSSFYTSEARKVNCNSRRSGLQL